MKILLYSLLTLSGILGLIVGGLGIILGSVFHYSPVDTDQAWGWAIIAFSLGYLAHPVLIYWLFKNGHHIAAMGITAFFLICSGLLVFFLPSAIEAGARP